MIVVSTIHDIAILGVYRYLESRTYVFHHGAIARGLNYKWPALNANPGDCTELMNDKEPSSSCCWRQLQLRL